MARAVARAHLNRGSNHGSLISHRACCERQIEIFREEGVDLGQVKIDHCNDTTDTESLEWILDQGLFSRVG